MRTRFDEQLEQLNKEMITMGMLCEHAIEKAAQALLAGDGALAGRLPEMLTQVKQKGREIEHICLSLLLHEQPVARDLRTVSAALKMVTDIERIGVQSTDVAEIVAMRHIRQVDGSLPVRDMVTAVVKMVTDSMDAFVKKDMNIARAVVKYDDVVDGYFNDVKQALIRQLREPEADGEAILDLLMIAKYLERIGDHAVNIAKWVQFSITGRLTEG